VSTIVTEKRGVLTDDSVTVHSILSLDERYSDFDILGLATGLLALEPKSGLSQAIIKYAEDHTIFPSTASEPEIVFGAGVRGVVFNERFAVLSAAQTLAEGYIVDEEALATYKSLGNSVSYVVDKLQVIGVITFGDTLSKSLISLNDFFVKRHLSVKIASGDTVGATASLQKMMSSLTDIKADLTPDNKQAQLDEWLANKNTMFVTNQDNLPDDTDAITVAVNRPDLNADIHVEKITDLRKFWATADRLIQIDKKMLRWASLPVIILLLLAAGLGIFISPWLYISPIIAVIIRYVMSYMLRLQIKNKK
jgi:cation transport ATPase